MTRFFLACVGILFLLTATAAAQTTVTVIGPVVPGDIAAFNSTTVLKDSGLPASALPTGLASPTGAVGLTPVIGVATTAMRSDAAPPLSASIQAALTGTTGELLIGTGGFGYAAIVLGGDCTFTSPNVTCTKTNGTPFGTFATANAATPPAIGGTTPNTGAFSSLTDTGIAGSTQCVQANSGGLFSGTGVPCGSGSGGSGSLQPTGRLTLVSAKPVMGTSQAAATTVYYTPYLPGDSVPLFNGSTFTPTSFTEVSQATTDTTKSPAAVAASSCYDLFAWSDSGTFRVTRGPVWTNSTTRSAGSALTTGSIPLNSVSITNGPAASRGTWVGSMCSNASSTIDYIFGGIGSGGVAAVFNLSNAYNQVPVRTIIGDSTPTWTYAVVAWRAANNSATIRATFVAASSGIGVSAEYYAQASGSGVSNDAAAGVGFDTTTAFCGTTQFIPGNASSIPGPAIGKCSTTPNFGQHFLSAIEYNQSTTTATWFGLATFIQTGLQVELWQ